VVSQAAVVVTVIFARWQMILKQDGLPDEWRNQRITVFNLV
jgi:hypothetical protein